MEVRIVGDWTWGYGLPWMSCSISDIGGGRYLIESWGESGNKITGQLTWCTRYFQGEIRWSGDHTTEDVMVMRIHNPLKGNRLAFCHSSNGADFSPPVIAAPYSLGLAAPLAWPGDLDLDLELDLWQVVGLGARVWHRPPRAPRAPLAVVLCPGSPAPGFACSMDSRLCMELETAFTERHLPLVCFDYTGTGKSLRHPRSRLSDSTGWRVPSNEQMAKDIAGVAEWVRENLSDRVLLCGDAFGASRALNVALEGHVYAYALVGLAGHRGGRSGTAAPVALEGHAQLRCRCLYVLPESGRVAPVEKVQRLAQARPDGGALASVKVISQERDAKQTEFEAGYQCAEWAASLYKPTESGTM